MTSKGYDHVSPVSVPSSFRLHYCDRLIQDEDSKLKIIFNRKTIACGYVFLFMSLYTFPGHVHGIARLFVELTVGVSI